MSAASYLSYGGVLKVVRVGDADLNNANAGVGIASTNALKIDNYDDYQNNHESGTNYTWAAKNPGSWGNGLKVCVIDDLADQRIGINTTNLNTAGAIICYGVTAALNDTVIVGLGTTSTFNGYLKGIITGVSTDATGGNSTIDVKVVARVETTSGVNTTTKIDYSQGVAYSQFDTSDSLFFVNNSGINTGKSADVAAYTPVTAKDWYDQQTLDLDNAVIYWKTIAPKPVSNVYSLDRNGKGDGIHVVVVDDFGTITGNQGTILEKFVSLSKAQDAVSNVDAPTKIYYKQYVADRSDYVYAGNNPSAAADLYHGTEPRAVGFSTDYTPITTAGGLWRQKAQDVTFASIGNVTYALGGGEDYSAGVPEIGANGGMEATLGNLVSGYDLFLNRDEIAVDYLIMGPGLGAKNLSQAKANHLISLANSRKDCMAVIGPHRGDLVNETNSSVQTDNLIEFFSPLQSSSYAVFDSGYAYKYDRFNNEFRYVPTNADIAGLMVRTAIQAYPWFSPAGQQRGILNNVVKLAYNPNKDSKRSIVSSEN